MAGAGFDTQGLSFSLTTPDRLVERGWDQWADLERRAYTADFPDRTLDEIEAFLDVHGSGDNPSFRERRIDPNKEVGKPFAGVSNFIIPFWPLPAMAPDGWVQPIP